MRLIRNPKISLRDYNNINNQISSSIRSLIPSSVFWDFENCQFPKDVPTEKFIPAIKDALSKYGCFAKEIHAIGHFSQLSQYNLKGLTELGVTMTDVPSKKSGSADISILTAIARTIYFNKPPYGMVLISGDRDFSSIVNFMNQVGYSVILVSDLDDPFRLALSDSAAHKVKWSSLIKKCPNVQILPSFKNWLNISDMVQCVKYLTGECLSYHELLLRLPPIETFRTRLFRDLSQKDITLQEYVELKKSKGLREQKLESILPALWFFISKFGDRYGSIYDIPEEYALECGFTDQFHWALIAEYYDLLEVEQESRKVRVPRNVISSLKDKEIPNSVLCRFLNTIMYSRDSNLEARLILSSIPNPQIGPLKMDQSQFLKQKSKWMLSESSFSDRIVARVSRNEVALVLPWLMNEDPIENGRAIDQMNFLYQHSEFIPLIQYIQNNPSDILDIIGFQNQNNLLLERCNLKSWSEYYYHASNLIDGIEISESSLIKDDDNTKLTRKKFSPHYIRQGEFTSGTTEYKQKNRHRLSDKLNNPADQEIINSKKTISEKSDTIISLESKKDGHVQSTSSDAKAKPNIDHLEAAKKSTKNVADASSLDLSSERAMHVAPESLKSTKQASTENYTSQNHKKNCEREAMPKKQIDCISEPENMCAKISISHTATELSDFNHDSFYTLANNFPSEKGYVKIEDISVLLGNIPVLFNFKNVEEYLNYAHKLGIVRTQRDKMGKISRLYMEYSVRKKILLKASLIWITVYFETKTAQKIHKKELESFFPMIHKEYGFKEWDEFLEYCESLKILTTHENEEVQICKLLMMLPKNMIANYFLNGFHSNRLEFFSDLAILAARKKFEWIPIKDINTFFEEKYNASQDGPKFLASDYIKKAKSLGIQFSTNGSDIKMNAILSARIRRIYLEKRMETANKTISKQEKLNNPADQEIIKSKKIISEKSDTIISLESKKDDQVVEIGSNHQDCKGAQSSKPPIIIDGVSSNALASNSKEKSKWGIFGLLK